MDRLKEYKTTNENKAEGKSKVREEVARRDNSLLPVFAERKARSIESAV